MYPSDLTDAQWLQLEPPLKPPRGAGRPHWYELRRVMDAMLYVVKTGCQWRQIPVNFPPWQSVYQQFRSWRDGGVWEHVTQALRERDRKAKKRNAAPTVRLRTLRAPRRSSVSGASLVP